MGTLKDALLKAGVKPTVVAKPPKAQNEREKIAKKKITETVIHQEQRNYCEACEQVRPDVELYKHRNPTTEAEWICLRCADQLQILDSCRKSAQSDTSVRKMFRREYGATASITDLNAQKLTKPQGPANGNR